MKQVNITVSFDEEKLTALKRYMAKKDLEPETELAEALKKLYERYVPGPVREYIDENDAAVNTPKPRRVPKSKTRDAEESRLEVTHHEQP